MFTNTRDPKEGALIPVKESNSHRLQNILYWDQNSFSHFGVLPHHVINEITDPIPREHAACIVRAGALMKRIIKLRDSQEMMDLGGIDNAMSTDSWIIATCGYPSENSCKL